MGSKCFVICDSERHYADSLASVLAEKIEFPIHVCSSVEQVKRLTDEREVGILLIEETFPEEEREELHAANQILLVRKEVIGENDGIKTVYKYQPADAILSEILASCMDENHPGMLRQQLYRDSALIGIYSPIHRIGKTALALEIGKELAKEERVLYLNLEEYSGWEERFGRREQYTLADFLYYAKQEKSNLGMRLSIMTGHMEELEYIAPVSVSEDLKHVTFEEWKELLEQLLNLRIYKKIVIDFGESVQGLWGLLNLCQKIYMPVNNQAESRAKLAQFEKNAEILGFGDLLKRVKKVETDGNIEGRVRQLLEREV